MIVKFSTRQLICFVKQNTTRPTQVPCNSYIYIYMIHFVWCIVPQWSHNWKEPQGHYRIGVYHRMPSTFFPLIQAPYLSRISGPFLHTVVVHVAVWFRWNVAYEINSVPGLEVQIPSLHISWSLRSQISMWGNEDALASRNDRTVFIDHWRAFTLA